MAIYRNVQLSFWTDNKVEDEFTPEDKYFYLYLLTNPQTNICGCYEVSYSQMTRHTGYNKETIQKLLERFDKVHHVLKFNSETKEILILHWYKYNWSKSDKVMIGIESVAKHIKSKELRDYVYAIMEMVKKGDSEIPYKYPIVTSDSDSDTDTDSDSDSDTDTVNKRNKYKDLLNKLLLEVNISDYLLEAVNNWIGYKEERNFKYKERGLRTLLKTISDKSSQFGDEAVTNVINESISNGYQGIVWDKLKNGNKKSSWKKDSREEQFDNLMEQIRRDAENDN